jgi:hypothetical protein
VRPVIGGMIGGMAAAIVAGICAASCGQRGPGDGQLQPPATSAPPIVKTVITTGPPKPPFVSIKSIKHASETPTTIRPRPAPTTIPTTVRPVLRPVVVNTTLASPATTATRPPRPTVTQPVRPTPQPSGSPAMPAVARPASTPFPMINPGLITNSAAQAQAGVNACLIVLTHIGGPPVLNGDIMCGFGFWNTVPMGWRFQSLGHIYQVVNRTYLPNGGGMESASYFGGDLDLHACLPSGGSGVTWAKLVG